MKNKNIWLGSTAAILLLALIFRQQILNIGWQYFWGPIVADATGSQAVYNGITASKGYNLYNTALYALTAAGSIYLIDRLLKKWGIGTSPRFVISLFPLLIFGGLLRVLEDTATLIPYPANTLLITPVIYFLMFFIALSFIRISIYLGQNQILGFQSYHRPLAWLGSLASLLVLSALTFHGYTQYSTGSVLPQGIGTILLLVTASILLALGLQKLLAQHWPETMLATTIGSLAVVSQVMDGAATVGNIRILGYSEKHVLSDFIIQTTGTSYSFLLLKTALILSILAAIPKEDADDRFTLLILLGIMAVGLGPAIRNIARAVLGV